MGSQLGPTYANIFLCVHELLLLEKFQSEFRPVTYRRYVDDTFLLFRNINQKCSLFITQETSMIITPKKFVITTPEMFHYYSKILHDFYKKNVLRF